MGRGQRGRRTGRNGVGTAQVCGDVVGGDVDVHNDGGGAGAAGAQDEAQKADPDAAGVAESLARLGRRSRLGGRVEAAGFVVGDAEHVVVLAGVLVQDLGLESEAGGGNVGNHPVGLPDGVARRAHGRGAVVQLGQVGIGETQGGAHVGVGRKAGQVADGQVLGRVEAHGQTVARAGWEGRRRRRGQRGEAGGDRGHGNGRLMHGGGVCGRREDDEGDESDDCDEGEASGLRRASRSSRASRTSRARRAKGGTRARGGEGTGCVEGMQLGSARRPLAYTDAI